MNQIVANQRQFFNTQATKQFDFSLKQLKKLERVLKANEQNKKGEFVYIALKKHNQNFVEQIESAKDTKAVLKIWSAMKTKSFLNYNVDLQKQEAHTEEFKAITLSEQKQHLVELLDKNQLYVNLSSLDDKGFSVLDEDKKVARDFYQLKK